MLTFVVLVLKNIQCNHVLSGERYSSHGKARRELNLFLLTFVVEITLGAIAHIYIGPQS